MLDFYTASSESGKCAGLLHNRFRVRKECWTSTQKVQRAEKVLESCTTGSELGKSAGLLRNKFREWKKC